MNEATVAACDPGLRLDLGIRLRCLATTGDVRVAGRLNCILNFNINIACSEVWLEPTTIICKSVGFFICKFRAVSCRILPNLTLTQCTLFYLLFAPPILHATNHFSIEKF